MKRNYKRPFYQYVKKASKPLKLAVEDAVDLICQNPEIGERKVGDIDGIRVYKFRFNRQKYLIAYRCLPDLHSGDLTEPDELSVDFYKIGSHENFYDSLKRYLQRS